MKKAKAGLVSDIMMSAPVTLAPDDNLDLASNVISLGRIRHIPIVEAGKLVGLITARDLIGTAANRIFGLKKTSKAALLKSLPVKEVMRKRVATVRPDTPIKNAARLMADKRIGCVPVVAHGALVGLVTTTDILRYVEGLG